MRKKVKRKKNIIKQFKNKKSWFKLVQVSLFRYFLLIYFRFSTIIITFATKYQFKQTSNNLKRYINNVGV